METGENGQSTDEEGSGVGEMVDKDWTDKMVDLRARARNLSEPYRTRALANIRDADHDLAAYPDWEREIVEDCARAVEAHEQDYKEGGG